MVMFLFLVIALAVVVAAVTLAVVGGGERGRCPTPHPSGCRTRCRRTVRWTAATWTAALPAGGPRLPHGGGRRRPYPASAPNWPSGIRRIRIAEVAAFTEADRERQLADAGIIRNRARCATAGGGGAVSATIR
ncbi:hypothetical protein SVIOM342S_00202 [Streptomyces violaceorubidus]